MFHGALGVSGHEEDRDPGAGIAEPPGQFDSVHSGHDDIGNQQVDRSLAALADRERLVPVRRFHDGVAVPLETFDREFPHHFLVLDQEDRFLSGQLHAHRTTGFLFRLTFFHKGFRQVHGNGGSSPRGALHADVAVALLHDSVHRGQTEARALPLLLRCVERLEDPGQDLLVHAAPVVDDLHGRVSPGGDRQLPLDERRLQGKVCGGNHQLSAPGHGVPGVDDEIHQDLLDLTRIRANSPWIRGRLRDELDVLPDQAPEHLPDVFHHLRKLQEFPLQDLAPAEGEELPCQGRSAFARPVDLFELPARRVLPVEFEQKQLSVPRDHREEVVEIVRHAPRQFPHRLHLLGLTELFLAFPQRHLRPFRIADVGDDRHHGDYVSTRVGEGRSREGKDDLRSVAPPRGDLRVGEFLSSQDQIAGHAQLRVPFRGKERVRVADRVLFPPPEQADGGRVPHTHHAGSVADDHGQRRRLDQGLQGATGLPQRLLCPGPFRKVVLDALQHHVVRPDKRRDLVSPGSGIESLPGVFTDDMQRLSVQPVQRPDEGEREDDPDQGDAEQEENPPLHHLDPVFRQEVPDDADVRLDHKTELVVDDFHGNVRVRPVIGAVHLKNRFPRGEAALRKRRVVCLVKGAFVRTRDHTFGGRDEHLASGFLGDPSRERVVDPTPEEDHSGGLLLAETVDGNDGPYPPCSRPLAGGDDLFAF